MSSSLLDTTNIFFYKKEQHAQCCYTILILMPVHDSSIYLLTVTVTLNPNVEAKHINK